MADSTQEDERRDAPEEGEDDAPEEPKGETMPAAELAQTAKESLEALTGYASETVSALQWDGEAWVVSIEVCELERVPNTTDVMATYEVRLDEAGRLLGYKRTHRYARAQLEER